ncbi:MAG TPA: hypothetical protein VGM05_19275 [Planctomycetaceae bacterium]
MKFYRPAEVPEDDYGLLCRQSRFAGVVRLIILCIVLAIPSVVGWNTGKPWLFWTFVAVAAVVIPMAVLDLRSMFRATNWLLRIGYDGMWINLRSYRDRDVGLDALSVVHLDYGEIAGVGQHTESYTTPSKMATGPYSNSAIGGSTAWRDQFLEIQLNHDWTEELITTLNDLRFPPAPAQSPSGNAAAQVRISPVWFVNRSVLRIAWISGHGAAILPRLPQVLGRLDGVVPLSEATRRERPNWRKLTADQATDLAREIVHVHGDGFAATALLTHVCGMSQGEANRQVRQFEETAIT